jgi:hypothetical protein
VSEPAGGPVPYRVEYSGRVREELRRLAARAVNSGVGQPFFAAIREIDQRLRLYPQFGQPLRDLHQKPLQIWIGVVPPLVVQYILDEERREVTVAVPILPLSRSGIV